MRYLAGAIVPIAILLIWEFSVQSGFLPRSQSASPTEIVLTIGNLLSDFSFLRNVWVSTLRVVVGVGLGAAFGATVGVIVAANTPLRIALSPLLAFLAGVPVVVWMPFWIMTFGTGEIFRIGLVGIAAFFLVYSVAFITTRRASRTYYELLQIYEKPALFSLLNIYIPSAASAIFTGMRLALGLGWVILFFVEYAVARPGSEGLGWFVANARAVGRVEQEFAGLILLGIIAYGIDVLMATLQKATLGWADAIEDRPE